MSDNRTADSIGWHDSSPDDPEVVELRDHLDANGGITGIELVDPGDVERAVRIFRRDGFVVIRDALDVEQLASLKSAAEQLAGDIVDLDPERSGNRGSHRYSYGAASSTKSQMHRREWQMLIDLPTISPIITAIFGSPAYMLRYGSGDFCLPGAVSYQPLHSDMRDFADEVTTPFSAFQDPRGLLTTRDLPCPYIAVNFLMIDATPSNGSTRQIPGTQNSREPIPRRRDEPEWMRLSTVCPAPAGSAMIRDVRAWHGGTPNLSNDVRCIPNVEFYAPWYREPVEPCIPYADYQQLSDHAKAVAKFSVLDSSETVEPTLQLGSTPKGHAATRTGSGVR